MVALTKRQREIYEFIRDCIGRNGYAPSFEEIGRRIGTASAATIHKHLTALEGKGAIRRRKNQSRAIELTGAAEFAASRSLPLLGQVAAGAPIEAVEDPQEVAVPAEFVGQKSSFVLRVRGDSMIDEQIRDGDLIIVERRDSAENGQTVVALIDGTESTVKKFYQEERRIRLQPANAAMKPMYYAPARVAIQGVVIGLMRKYKS
ncbi:MAG: transcriptional repressor LexA [Candidatus Sumerlaeota bacterium]|nr:transcriptional repressor LexA [Candidatus Sumerlaeota bacterium]